LGISTPTARCKGACQGDAEHRQRVARRGGTTDSRLSHGVLSMRTRASWTRIRDGVDSTGSRSAGRTANPANGGRRGRNRAMTARELAVDRCSERFKNHAERPASLKGFHAAFLRSHKGLQPAEPGGALRVRAHRPRLDRALSLAPCPTLPAGPARARVPASAAPRMGPLRRGLSPWRAGRRSRRRRPAPRTRSRPCCPA